MSNISGIGAKVVEHSNVLSNSAPDTVSDGNANHFYYVLMMCCEALHV